MLSEGDITLSSIDCELSTLRFFTAFDLGSCLVVVLGRDASFAAYCETLYKIQSNMISRSDDRALKEDR